MMLHEVDLHLAERIAAIETRGSTHLRTLARRAAIGRALAVAMPLTLLVPTVAWFAGWFAPLRWPVVLGAAVLVPVLTFGALLALHMRQLQVRRDAAIAVFDRALALKDRVAATDQFLRDPDDNPFKAAAMREAAPWIAEACTAALPPSPHARIATGWGFPTAALALLAITAAQQIWLPATAGGDVARVLATAGVAAPGAMAPTPGNAKGDDRNARAAGSAGGAQSSTPLSAGQAGAPAGRQSGGAGGNAAGAGRVGDASGFTTPIASQGSNAGAAQSQGRSASAGAAGASAGATGLGDGRKDAQSASADASRGARAAPDGEATATNRGAPQTSGAAASQPPSAPPISGRQRPQPGKSGNAGQDQQSRGEQSGSQTQPGRGKSQGRDGQRTGQDSLKRANGIAAMLLAVPMTDRLGGTANPGLVTDQPQRVPPRAGRSADRAAGNRGTGAGDVGRLPHRPSSAQERRVVRDYFGRRGAEQ